MPKETFLESIYWDREQGVLANRSELEKEVSYEIQKDGNEEKLRKLIDKIYNQRLRNKIDKYLDLTLEDMLKRESATLDKYYKQGFKDGINLLIECIS
jgi:predicted metal-dependent hydrolase